MAKEKNITLNDLGAMVNDGFDGMQKNMDKRLDNIDKRLDNLERGQDEIKLKFAYTA